MELTDREQASASAKISWTELLRYRQTWAVFFCRFLADPLWYFFVFWIPEFLTRERGLNLAGIAMVAWIPFLVADASNFGGGYMSFRLQKEKQEADRKRIEAEGIRDFQRTVTAGISDQLLVWKGIEATEKLAGSNNTKIVVVGNSKNGLPLILGQ